jgi:hypothetical protein
MPPLERPDRQPAARTVVEPPESTTDALLRAAKQADVDLSGPGAWVQDLVDGDALDRLFLDPESGSDAGRAALLLELWDHLFVLTPAEIEVYETEEAEPPTPERT